MASLVRRYTSEIGYAILSLAVIVALFFTFQNNAERDDQRQAVIEQGNRINSYQCSSLRKLYTSIRAVFQDQIDSVRQSTRIDASDRRVLIASYQRQLERFEIPACPPNIRIEDG